MFKIQLPKITLLLHVCKSVIATVGMKIDCFRCVNDYFGFSKNDSSTRIIDCYHFPCAI